jgi:hypothetical protein
MEVKVSKESKDAKAPVGDWRFAAMLFREVAILANAAFDDLRERISAGNKEEAEGLLGYIGDRLLFLLDWIDHRCGHTMFKLADDVVGTSEYKEFVAGFEDSIGADCGDCGAGFDSFMVRDELWGQHGNGDGRLCMGCLEKRMGRRLLADDFTECGANDANGIVRALRGLPQVPGGDKTEKMEIPLPN